MAKGRLAKFKINPGNYNPYKPSFKHYYNIHVFDTQENMVKFGDRLRPGEHKGVNWSAKVIPSWRHKEINGQIIIAPKVGDALFYQDRLIIRIVSHECVHMGTSFLRLLNFRNNYDLKLGNQIDDHEENLAYVIGNCCDQIYENLVKFGL